MVELSGDEHEQVHAKAWDCLPGDASWADSANSVDWQGLAGELERHVERGFPAAADAVPAIRITFDLAALVNYYAHEGHGGAETVQNDMEGEIAAVDVADVEGALARDVREMLELLRRGGWQVERRFPQYGWRLDELAKIVLAELCVLSAVRQVLSERR